MAINTQSKLKIFIMVAILLAICPRNSISSEKDWTLRVQGIKVIGRGYKTSSENVMPFNQFKGTAVACLLSIKSGGIISFVDIKSSIKEFKDNLGTNLIDSGAMHGNEYGLMREISKDRSVLMFEIVGSNLPDKQATSLIASGQLVVNTATKNQNIKVQNINFSKGTVVKTPFANLKIVSIEKSSWGDQPYRVQFESSSNLSVIRNIQFTHLNGQIIESNRSGGGSHNIIGDTASLKYEIGYSISEIPAKINISIDFWADMKSRNIPFSFKTSLGL